MSKMHLVENAQIVEALPPATDAAGRTGDYVSLRNAVRAFIICHITQANAATVALSLFQATSFAAAGEKALSAVARIWSNLDTATSDLLVSRGVGASYTTDTAIKNKIVVFEVEAAMLDVSNGFDCVTVKTGASNVANITQAMFVLGDIRFAGVSMPSAIA